VATACGFYQRRASSYDRRKETHVVQDRFPRRPLASRPSR
jgi:hypothetical protein